MPSEQQEMFPYLPDPKEQEVWDVADRYYKANPHTYEPPTRRYMAQQMNLSVDGFDNRKKRYKIPWPIKRGMHPRWVPAPVVDPAPVAEWKAVDRLPLQSLDGRKVEVDIDEHGVFHFVRYIASLAAAIAVALVLDAMDGRVDNHISWCRIFVEKITS